MLETGNLGGKCADLNALFVGLARAAGMPARDVYGVRTADSAEFKCLGKSGDITKAQHCRAEFYTAEPRLGARWIRPTSARSCWRSGAASRSTIRPPRRRGRSSSASGR